MCWVGEPRASVFNVAYDICHHADQTNSHETQAVLKNERTRYNLACVGSVVEAVAREL